MTSGADNDNLARREMEQRLCALGLTVHTAKQVALDEFSAEAAGMRRDGGSFAERVLPHPDGWLVTASIDAADAEIFDGVEEATARASERSVIGNRFGVLVYSRDGRIAKRIHFPKWR